MFFSSILHMVVPYVKYTRFSYVTTPSISYSILDSIYADIY